MPMKLMDLIDVFYNFFYSPLLLFLLPLFLLIVKQSRGQNLPPGPRPWPIIGNIPSTRKKPNIRMTELAQVHGPLMSLRFGSQLLVVGSSPAAAMEILKTHDALLCARSVPKGTMPDFGAVSLVWASECGDQWKSLRALCRAELFSGKAMDSKSTLRENKVAEMVAFLGSKEGKIVKIGEIVFATIFNTLSHIFFSKDFVGLEGDQEDSGLKGKITRMMVLGGTPSIGDFFPILKGLDLQGRMKKVMVFAKEVFGVWEIIIKERRESNGHDSSKLQDLLGSMLASGYSDDQINLLTLELFTAGADTTTSTIEWAMAELLKNKEAMYKINEEISKEINSDSIKESHLSRLPYLNACVKETLRLHPPTPFLLPHRALDTCQVMNYTIPKGSRIIINVWAIGRDPKIWDDPLSFKPERFLNSNVDFKGQDFELLPFGAGRRICPGIPLATKQIQLILASLIYHFQWLLPNNMDPSQLNMDDKFGVTLHKEQPLLLIPKHK